MSLSTLGFGRLRETFSQFLRPGIGDRVVYRVWGAASWRLALLIHHPPHGNPESGIIVLRTFQDHQIRYQFPDSSLFPDQ